MTRRRTQNFKRRLSPLPLMRLFPTEMSSRDIASICGLSASTVLKYRSGKQKVDWLIADRVAVRLGKHPMTIWQDEWCEMVVEEPR